MDDQPKSPIEQLNESRGGLAAERDAAVERANVATLKLTEVLAKTQGLTNDITVWMISFMLHQGINTLEIPQEFVAMAREYKLLKSVSPSGGFTWSISKQSKEGEGD